MILTPIPRHRLVRAIAALAASVGDRQATRLLRRIATPAHARRASGASAALHHREAVRLAARLGLGRRQGAPQRGLSWDGRALNTATKAYVLLHEVAHYQVAPSERRRRVDFGLGAGPETGERAVAERRALRFGVDREREEAMVSLLGILWELELGQPALASFLDQNWLEGSGRAEAGRHLTSVLAELRALGLVTETGHPTFRLRRTRDGTDRDSGRVDSKI